jgi:hypothetical protein
MLEFDSSASITLLLVYSIANNGETGDRAVAFLKGVRHIQWVQSISPSAHIPGEPELSIGACPF